MKNYEKLKCDNPDVVKVLLELMNVYTVQELIGLIKSIDATGALYDLVDQPLSYVSEEKSG